MQAIYDRRYRRAIHKMKDTRIKLGLTQDQVAQKLGWRRTMLCNIENYERRLDLLEAHTLAQALGLKLADLDPLLQSNIPHPAPAPQ
jgi:DNA-binding XRE family transcriptional regulator